MAHLGAVGTHGPAQPRLGSEHTGTGCVPQGRGGARAGERSQGRCCRHGPVPPGPGPIPLGPSAAPGQVPPPLPLMAPRPELSHLPAAWRRCPHEARPVPLCPARAPPEAEAAVPRGSGGGARSPRGRSVFTLPVQPPSRPRPVHVLGLFLVPFRLRSRPQLRSRPYSRPHSRPRSHSRACHGGPRQLREQQRAGLFCQAHQRLLPRGHRRLRELLQVRRARRGPAQPCPWPRGALTRRFIFAACSRGSSSGPSRWFMPPSPAAASSAGCVWVREAEGAPGGSGVTGRARGFGRRRAGEPVGHRPSPTRVVLMPRVCEE